MLPICASPIVKEALDGSSSRGLQVQCHRYDSRRGRFTHASRAVPALRVISTSSHRRIATPGNAAGRPHPRLRTGGRAAIATGSVERQAETMGHEDAVPDHLSSAGALHLLARQQLTVRRNDERLVSASAATRRSLLERVTGIEPALSAWEADVLPLNYTRKGTHCTRSAPPTAEPPHHPDKPADAGRARAHRAPSKARRAPADAGRGRPAGACALTPPRRPGGARPWRRGPVTAGRPGRARCG